MIKTVFFDFFGVISSEVSPKWFAQRYEHEEAVRLKDEFMTPADRGEVTLAELLEGLSRLSGDEPDVIHKDFLSRAVLNRNLLPIMEKIRKNYRVVLLSNALPEWLHEILTRDGLYRFFDRLIISGEVRMIKPNREIFDYALSVEQIEADEAVFIDDNPKNVSAALGVGIHALRFTSNEELEIDLKRLGVNF